LKSAAEEISGAARLMRAAERAEIEDQVKSLASEKQPGLSKGGDFELER